MTRGTGRRLSLDMVDTRRTSAVARVVWAFVESLDLAKPYDRVRARERAAAAQLLIRRF